jgi:ketosteroid isomerase-like protein
MHAASSRRNRSATSSASRRLAALAPAALAALAALASGALVGCGGGGNAAPVAPTASATPAGERFSAADREAVAKVLADQAAAWNRGDLDGYMAGYLRSPALVFTSGGHVRTGYDETFISYKRKYGTEQASMGTLAFDVVRIDPVGDGGAVVLGRWDLKLAASRVGGVFSVVMERTPSGWLIIHDHTSSDPEPKK